MSLVHTVLLGVLAGPLLVAGIAKLAADPERLSWPYARGPLGRPHGPRLVGTAEVAIAVALLALPALPAAALGLVAYLGLAVVAARQRGVPCACFGVARLAAIGRFHIVLNASGAAVAVVLAVATFVVPGAGSPWWLRPVGAVVAGALVLAAVRRADRREGVPDVIPPAGSTASGGPISAVRLYVSANCPACRSLRQHLQRIEPARRDAVEVISIDAEAAMPAELHGRGVPTAVAVGRDGDPVREPATGISAVNALIDGIALRAAVRQDGASELLVKEHRDGG